MVKRYNINYIIYILYTLVFIDCDLNASIDSNDTIDSNASIGSADSTDSNGGELRELRIDCYPSAIDWFTTYN